MKKETSTQSAERIIKQLMKKYPGKEAFDLDGRGKHFVCEVEPTKDHPEYDRAVEVIILSKPHKHLKMTQYYTVLTVTLELHLDKEKVILNPGDKYVVHPGTVHWAKSSNECWVELYSKPGWTANDHIPVSLS